MRPRIGYKKLAAVGVAAVVGVASTIALTSGSASAAPVFGYSGYAHGTFVQSGLAGSGAQVSSIFGCSTTVGLDKRNELATANVNEHALARAVNTETYTHDDDHGNGVTSTASAADIKLGSLLILTGASTTTSAVYKNGKFEYSGGTTFQSVKIGGLKVPSLLKPAPNTKVAVPGLGYIMLNRVGGSKTSSGVYSFSQAVVIHSTVKNKYYPVGAAVVVLMTKAEVGGPATAMVIGDAYGTKTRVDNLVKSGPTSYQTSCRGTDGKLDRISLAEAKVPGLARVGAVATTKNGVIGADRSAIEFTSKVAGVTVGTGRAKLVLGTIESSASASKTKDGKVDLQADSKVVSVSVGDKKYSVPHGTNQKLTIPGIAELTFNKVTRQGRYISVDAVEITVPGLDTVVSVGHSAAGIIG